MENQCGGVRPKITARIETDRDREPVGGVSETSEVMGTEQRRHSNDMSDARDCAKKNMSS